MAPKTRREKKLRSRQQSNLRQPTPSGRGASIAPDLTQPTSSTAITTPQSWMRRVMPGILGSTLPDPGHDLMHQPLTPLGTASTPTQLSPRQKLGLVNLTPDFNHDQIDPQSPDIIAIHGIGGDPYRTWTHENGALWLRDFLPKNIKGARIFSFGYDAEVALTRSQTRLDDFARSLLNKLRVERDGELQSRPLIFICHSMGGIVLKRALTNARLEDEDEFPFLQSSVKGIFFLGTPHDGSDAVSWPQLLADILHVGLYAGTGLIGAPRNDLLRGLERNSEVLKSISIDFRNQAKNIKIFSCIEQHSTFPLSKLIVDRNTGVLGFPGEIIIPMDGCDHRTLCRFSDEEDPNYRVIRSRIGQLIVCETKPRAKDLPLELKTEQKNCLRHLYFPDMEVRQHDINPAANNTCTWLFEHAKFREWSSHQRGLLWISGNPGAGKSTLLKYALQKTTNDGSAIQNKPIILSFFFHGRGSELQKTPLGFFRTILYQILDQAPGALSDLLQDFKKNCETKGKPGKKWDWHEAQLRDFLKQSLSKVSEVCLVQMFIDAIDEGGDKVARELVKVFQNLLAEPCSKSSFPVRICFTCRHYPIIEFEYGTKICAERENHKDVVTYVRERLAGKDTKLNEIRDMIINRASGIFQWARLVVDRVEELRLEGEVIKVIKEEIQRIPQDLHALYKGLLEHLREKERPTALNLIYWILFAIRPLSLDELRFATAIEPHLPYKSLQQYRDEGILMDSNEDMEKRVKTLSRGLAEIRLQKDRLIVQFIHHSVNDFLFKDGIRILLGSSWESTNRAIGCAHYRLSRSCIRFIDMEVHQQESEYEGYKIDLETDAWEGAAKTPFLEYAIESWVLHEQRAKGDGISQEDLLDYLRWPSDDLNQPFSTFYQHMA
ncbi:hypothetical protein AOQ84DRAFT_380441 [Glonium stellatum]|uniref:Nephrocystin 3-like N-terminal domain-containing protein n=1 Tax=Glonium stellatum TaxID=574774 RepID=A0A8E2ETZ2_9PEZI|nr:hypothetical protein AOQ84DRAFT_380441 [Glonium stellatum]